jgi:CxxC-x17-CxxC domain-containing protein
MIENTDPETETRVPESEMAPQPTGDSELQDRDVTCRECGATFTFTAGEQSFYRSRGFTNDPTCCPECRNKRRAARRSPRGDDEAPRVVCAACGVITTVPFRPTGGKPVYCRDCYPVRN